MHQSHKDFIERVLSHIDKKQSESVDIYNSLGRTITSDVKASHPFPAKDTVATNGYAIICSNTHDAPISLNIIGGSTVESPFSGEITNGQAVRTYIGCPLPEGADTVIADGECEVSNHQVRINKTYMQNQNIVYSGVDFQIDEVVLPKGSRISSIDLAIAASMKIKSLEVSSTSKIGVLEISDMIIAEGEGDEPEQSISTTHTILKSFIRSGGAENIDLGIVSETKSNILETLGNSEGVDLIVTIGGTSLSSSPALKNALQENDSFIEELKLILNEEVPIYFSKIGNIPVLCLPSHPISSHIASTLFLKPIIRHLNNSSAIINSEESAFLDRDLDIFDLKMDYIFSQLKIDNDKKLKAMPASSYDSVLISTLLNSDCLVQTDNERNKRGDIVGIIRMKD